MTRIVMDLAAPDDRDLIRLLRHLLKVLGRAYSVRCRSVVIVDSGEAGK